GLLAGCGGDQAATPAPGGANPTAATGGANPTTATGGAAATTASGGTGGGAGISNKYAGTTLNLVFANHAWNTGITPMLAEFEKASGMKLAVSSIGETQLSDQLKGKFTAGVGD